MWGSQVCTEVDPGLQTFSTMTELMTPQAIIQNVCDSLFLSGLIVLYRVVMAWNEEILRDENHLDLCTKLPGVYQISGKFVPIGVSLQMQYL